MLFLLLLIFVLPVSADENDCCVWRGDITHDGSDLMIDDLVCLVSYMFFQTDRCEIPCMEEADVNADGDLNIGDLVALVGYMFEDGPIPPPCSSEE